MIGIIGGSGFYDFLDDPKKIVVDTPFGQVTLESGMIADNNIVFIPRHGKNHSLAPSQINYRANIFAAHKLGVTEIFTTNAVGSLDSEIEPGQFAVPVQILDCTNGRKNTFFDGSGLTITTNQGRELSGVVHTDVTNPFSKKLRKQLLETNKTLGQDIIEGGTIVVTNGPRFETAAEITAYRTLGADYVGMTSSPEAFLAKELDIKYASLSVITNYAAGMQKTVSEDEVLELFSEKIDVVKELIRQTISRQ